MNTSDAARTVEPIVGSLDATVRLPGSKSITNRALVAAALARGESTLTGVGLSDDTRAMIGCLRQLGARIEIADRAVGVFGTAGSLTSPVDPLDANMSGTTARFVAPLLLLAGAGTITGHEQMRARPMGELVESLRQLGAEVSADSLPFSISVPDVLGSSVRIPADVSSQFVSGLLLSAPCFPRGLELALDGQVVSRPYIEMTLGVMAFFGAKSDWSGDRIRVEPTGFVGSEYVIEPDASTATYPLAAAAIVGGRVRVDGLGAASIQGDVGFSSVIEAMGADVFIEQSSIEVRGSGVLRAIDVDLGPMSDTAPTFGALAARAKGTSRATGIGFIRETKESDRVGGVVAELTRLGIDATVDADGFSVTGGRHGAGEVETYEDHRIAMAFGLLGLVDEPVTILDPGCVSKTFPGYFDMLAELQDSARTTPLVLAIDGPAGSGKSTVAALVAKRLRLPHLDTGAMYRSVTLAVLRSGVSIDNEQAVTRAAETSAIVVSSKLVTIEGEDVTADIRSPEVTAAVSPVAAISGVRRVLAAHQRMWAHRRGAAVVEGRDIGSAIFPEATMKVYLTASVKERARRRAAETGDTDLVAMEQRIAERDRIDSSREQDPLAIADDAIVIDSTDMDIRDVVAKIVSLWGGRRAEDGGR
ncbi:MAG: 3-phosphoshikimate 1-carboxyvinyltransferase [Acidimicrobiales bacterium]